MAEPTAADIRSELEKQIGDLKKEMSRLSKSMSARASEAIDDAGDLIEEAKGRAGGAAKQVRAQAQAVGEAIRENPGTAAVLSSAGIIGFLLGLVVGGMMAGNGRRGRW